MGWEPVATAPFDRDIELAVISYQGVHALAFACRRILGGWTKAETKERIDLWPTHWREWTGTTLGLLLAGRIAELSEFGFLFS
jgi:hypothetical protein